MNPKEILKAIDPKGAEIQRLQAELQVAKNKNDALLLEREAKKRHELERNWMREHGIMIETTEGMKYLKDKDFDKFFKRLKIVAYGFGLAPIKKEGSSANYDEEPQYGYELGEEE